MKLIELITASVLLGMLSTACAALVHAQVGLLRNVTDRAAASESLRTASAIVAAEMRTAAASDVAIVAPDSIALRAIRGWAIVSRTESGRTELRYEGVRQPDPLKDSVLVVGEERTAAFTLPAADPLAIETELPLPPGTLLIFFETGSYHLATNALRYRRGLDGRQPITDELIDHRASRFGMEADSRLLRLQLRAKAVRGRQATQISTRIRMVNYLP